jgi:hypothetical protein
MLILLAAAILSHPQPVQSPPSEAVTACGLTMTYVDQLCNAVIIRDQEWRHEDAAAAYERAAYSSIPNTVKAARNYAAAGRRWIAAGENEKAILALDRALANPQLPPDDRRAAMLNRTKAAEDLRTKQPK